MMSTILWIGGGVVVVAVGVLYTLKLKFDNAALRRQMAADAEHNRRWQEEQEAAQQGSNWQGRAIGSEAQIPPDFR